MAKSIRPRRVSHPNVIMEDYEASLAHLTKVYGARFLLDLPKPEWHACLVEIGGMIFEIFAPPNFLLHTRHGPQYLGIEYEADMTEVRQSVADHGVRIVRELQVAIHSNPADCFGVDFEFYEGSFFVNTPPVLQAPVGPMSYWTDEQPLGLTGLKAYTLAVSDIAKATAFIKSFVSGEQLYDEARPAIGARAVGLQVADSVLELITPTGPGATLTELQRIGEGIHSMIFGVRDLDKTRRELESHGVELVSGTKPGRLATTPETNRGIVFEFEAS